MEVVLVNDYASVTGGGTAVAFASARGLVARGIPVTLLTSVGPLSPEMASLPGLTVRFLDREEIVADPNRLRAFTRGIYNRESAQAIEQLLAARDPRHTLVHVHMWTKALSASVISTANRLGFKTIITLHDFFITCPTGGFFVQKDASLCFRAPLSFDCLSCNCDRRSYAQKLWRSARTFVQNHVLRVPQGVAHFIGVSEFSIAVMRPYMPADARISIVRNPVDCAERPPVAVAENAPFVFIGRFSTEKGPLVFAEAVRRLKVPAVFIGDGELLEQARAICPEATFTGWLSAAEVDGWIGKARALVFPPLWYETLGLVVVEAAARGVPAIVSDRCAATDFIKHEQNGLHFRHGSVDSLCEQITRLRDDALAAALGRAAYDWHWKKPWSTEQHVNDLLEVYERVLAGAPPVSSPA